MGIRIFSPQDQKIHHKSFNSRKKNSFDITLKYNSPQDHKKIFWWGVAIEVFSFSPQDLRQEFEFQYANVDFL